MFITLCWIVRCDEYGRKNIKNMSENLEVDEKVTTFAHVNETSRDGAEVARWAHNPKVVGSNPAPATKRGSPFGGSLIFYMLGIGMCAAHP